MTLHYITLWYRAMRFGLSPNTSLRCSVLGALSTQQSHSPHPGTTAGAVGALTTPGTTVHSARAGDSPVTRGGIGIGICAMLTPTYIAGQAHSAGGAGAECIAPHTTGDGTTPTIGEATGVTLTTVGVVDGLPHFLVPTHLAWARDLTPITTEAVASTAHATRIQVRAAAATTTAR